MSNKEDTVNYEEWENSVREAIKSYAEKSGLTEDQSLAAKTFLLHSYGMSLAEVMECLGIIAIQIAGAYRGEMREDDLVRYVSSLTSAIQTTAVLNILSNGATGILDIGIALNRLAGTVKEESEIREKTEKAHLN